MSFSNRAAKAERLLHVEILDVFPPSEPCDWSTRFMRVGILLVRTNTKSSSGQVLQFKCTLDLYSVITGLEKKKTSLNRITAVELLDSTNVQK